ncbi:MAG: GDP-mannose 4,6-dehydratase, partial [Candidatus Micrarchaeota archaeon]|nr:GDP-mannose 4,6-dehydratase [Candidatus Micrarchaeota archaeon]
TGITGQDGAYLARFLTKKGYDVYGTYRRISTPNFWRLEYLGVFDKVNLIPTELNDAGSLTEALKISHPNEIYHLAAHSFVASSFEAPIETGSVSGLSVMRLLEAVRQVCEDARFYFAGTSEMYGHSGLANKGALNEDNVFKPMSPYAASKLYGYWATRIYREGYKLFACNGLLFNHESPIRGLEFVTRKVTNGAAKIANGLSKELAMGNIFAKRDWGYAPEYVEAMWLMLQQKTPDDYVIATDEMHSVKELIEIAFERLGLDWHKHIKLDKRFRRPLDVLELRGNYGKAAQKLGWKPKTKFKELINIMVDEDNSRWQRWQKGESFPWDAPNYPHENKILTRAFKM